MKPPQTVRVRESSTVRSARRRKTAGQMRDLLEEVSRLGPPRRVDESRQVICVYCRAPMPLASELARDLDAHLAGCLWARVVRWLDLHSP